MPTRHLVASLLALALSVPACRPAHPDYAADEATFTRLRAAAATREVARHPTRQLRDTGAESARPAPARLFGVSDAAARRLFLVDASGSMQERFAAVRSHLLQALDGLPPDTAFALIRFSDDENVAALSPQWLMATTGATSRAAAFVDAIRPYGPSDPVSAFRDALALRPDTVYLLTDGDFPDPRAFRSSLDSLAPRNPFKLHIVAFGPPPRYDTDHALAEIAADHGGTLTRIP
jgi:hypothetical protein